MFFEEIDKIVNLLARLTGEKEKTRAISVKNERGYITLKTLKSDKGRLQTTLFQWI